MAAVLATAGLMVACGSATGERSEAEQPKEHGTLLATQPLAGDAVLPGAVRSEQITYLSRGPQGDDVEVSGSVSIPAGEAPEAGWPVISWAHGTTGVSDACAPSSGTVPGSDGEYLRYVNETLDQFLRAGYVVAQTDYVGLGTSGIHPYINGDSEAAAVTDIVRAARQLDSSVGTGWYAAGHSQGGHAALFAADQGPDLAPQLELRGAVSISPGNNLGDTVEYFVAGGTEARAVLGYLPLILLGAQAADPALDAYNYVTDEMTPLLEAAKVGCTDAVWALADTVPLDKVIRPGADFTPLVSYLTEQNPDRLSPRVPTLILQGGGDTSVTEPGSAALAESLCAKGSQVGYTVYDGLDHVPTVGASAEDTLAFLAAIEGGRTPAGLCGD
ncbi:lipase family protein [Rhodococcus sp. H29-C3]|uniref:alpha/beta hydrolase family protein n=1 Tax=Rhodococcus sp. H29-C3 TaxID=3046307 RepID=UPI0024BBB7EA|nr:lipase family protein [Rhodococcus sp. H29-C3]MDJ0362712.1 alpha/beta fold hydrolase [Rhodococcus sp. H29-C3]